jgi:hypothetical protein
MLTLALGESSLLVLDTIKSTEIGDSQSPYGAVFLVVVVDMVVVDVQVWLQSVGVTENTSKCKMRPAAVNGQQSQSKQVSICIRDFCSK